MSLPVYLINLPRDRQRLLAMATQLQQLDLPFECLPAVYGKALSPAEREALYDEQANAARFHTPLVDGEIGCYASHLRAWQHLLDSDAPAALVLEDDVLLRPSLLPVLRALVAQPAGWQMVKLIGRDFERPWWSQALTDGVALIGYRRLPSLTSAYVLSREGAARLLAARRPFFRPVDTDLRHWWECGLAVAGAYPYPVQHAQASQNSSIGQRDPGVGARRRWRKLWFQTRYLLCSAWFNLRRPAPSAGKP